ncbi:hypothetical protein [Jiangella anatolica]|uniref:hypothetical protein n=1 Tax=Jiangella anatolica TaxID=2670374 RepID=UPI0011B85E34|nr:hypothetical protein [Jiangella anatolica]
MPSAPPDGCRLYSAQFVLDYVQLSIDTYPADNQPVLACDVPPTVVLGDQRLVRRLTRPTPRPAGVTRERPPVLARRRVPQARQFGHTR